jgi:hypothetical protein
LERARFNEWDARKKQLSWRRSFQEIWVSQVLHHSDNEFLESAFRPQTLENSANSKNRITLFKSNNDK